MPVTAEEQRFLDACTLDLPWSLVEQFSAMLRWRPSDVNAAADVIAARLRQAGVPVEVHEPELYLSIPLSASAEMNGTTFRAKPPSSCPSVPGGVTAPIVTLDANPKALRSYSRDIATLFGGSVASVEQVRADVAGRIVVMQGFGNPALTSLIEEWGGAGLIAVNPGEDIHWGTCTTIWGNPDLQDLPRKPKIPVVAVNNPDGKRLMASRGQDVTIRKEMQEGWFSQRVPVAAIPGQSPDFLLLHGHYDSWDVGVGDNATGDACMAEIARVLWHGRDRLRRSVKVAWWPGHSTGRYAGSTWFADRFAHELDEHCIAQVNCDSPGCRWATSFHETRAFPESAALATAAIRDIVPGADIKVMRPPQAGDYSFNNIGLPSWFMLSSTMPEALRAEKGYYDVSGCGANIAWHTENDTMEIADRDNLLRDIRIYLLSILRAIQPETLPFDFQATCDAFLATIARYEQAGGGLADLSAARAATLALREDVERLQSMPPAKGNAARQALARALIPLDTTREPRFRHDPAYALASLPTLAVAAELPAFDGAARGFAQTELLRGQNRYVSALRAAARLAFSV